MEARHKVTITFSFVVKLAQWIYCQVYNSSLVPRPTPFFCSSVCVDNNTRMRKGSEKQGKPVIIHHMLYVKGEGGGATANRFKPTDKAV